MSRLDEIEQRLKAAWRPDTYVPEYNQSRWGQAVVSVTRCRDKPLTTLEFMPHMMGDTSYAEMLANAGEDLWFLLDRVHSLETGLRDALPYIKTVSRSGNTAYDKQTPDLYERLAALAAYEGKP